MNLAVSDIIHMLRFQISTHRIAIMPTGKSVPLAVRGAIVALHEYAGMDWKEICTPLAVLPETAREIYMRAKVLYI